MKKILSLFFVALFSVSMWATDATFYLAIDATTLGSATANVNIQLGDAQWGNAAMGLVENKTYGGRLIYKQEWNFPNNRYRVWEFFYDNDGLRRQIHDGNSWESSDFHDGKMYVYDLGTWVDYITDGTIKLVAGTGGEVSSNNTDWGASAIITDLASDQDVNIYARPNTGYEFSTWTRTSGTSSVKTNEAAGVYNGLATSIEEVTAEFTETMSTLTTSNNYDAGNPNYEDPSKSVTSIGYVTTATITATAAGEGYRFTGWTLTNCARTDGGSETATTITVRSNGDGAAASAVANYEEVLTSTAYLVGTSVDGKISFPDGWNINATSMMMKVTGHANEKVVYKDVTVSGTGTFEFKINYDGKWYGYGKGDTYRTWTETSTMEVYYEHDGGTNNNGNNLKLAADKTGVYHFKVDYSGSYPAVTITYPAGPATSIDETVISEKAIKRFENGQLIIIKNGVKYNALGAEVK